VIGSVASTICIFFVKIKEATDLDKLKLITPKGIGGLLEKKSLRTSMIMFFCAIAYSSILSFLTAFTIENEFEQLGSFFFIAYAAFLFISRPASGMIYDRIGENVVILPAFLLYSASFLIIAFSQNGYMILLAAVTMALGYGALSSVLQIVSIQIAPPENLGLAVSTYFVFLDAGTGIGAYINGAIVDLFGYRNMYYIMAGIVICLLPVYHLVHGRHARR
jgi:MFS family permease